MPPSRPLACGVAAALLLASAGSAGAQALRLAPDAEVRSLRFRFTGPHEILADDLAGQIATTAPGPLRGVHAALAWIPFVPEPGARHFDPVVLQLDLARLRRYYRRQGFLGARMDYAVGADRDRRFVDVRFLIEEGPPLRFRDMALAGPGGAPEVPLSDSGRVRLENAWARIRPDFVGHRFTEKGIEDLRRRIARVLADEGYALVTVEPRAAIDSIACHVDLQMQVDPGPRVRVAEIRVEGARSVSDRFVIRQLGFEAGDWASPRALERGRSNLLSADLFRQVELQLAPSRADSTPLTVRVSEDRRRFTKAEAGYYTDGAGVSGEASWTNPNFTGGARSLSTVGLIQTGWGSTADVDEQLLRVTMALTQPFLGTPSLSLAFGPSFEYEDGRNDRSTAWSGHTTLVYRINALQSAALRYEYRYEKIDLTVSQGLGLSSVAGETLPGHEALLDSLSVPRRTSLFTLFTNLGGLDDLSRPRHGMVVKPNLSVTAPATLGNIQFGRLDVQATAFAPSLGASNAIMFRGTVGALWPYGESVPIPGESPVVDLVQLRDYHLTAGGASDVRGYASRLLGPKVPQIEEATVDGDTILTSDHYVEVGGFRRWTASVELRIGLPMISRDVFAHLFGDAGRVWTTDPRFQVSQVTAEAQHAFYTAGGGIGYYTPVGAIRFDVGYKLNPSVLDLRRPQDVLDALEAGLPAESAPVDESRRFGFHFALGLFF